jgi:hypothetical protein
MGEAKRREQLEQGVRRLVDQGQGALEVELIHGHDALAQLFAAATGDQRAHDTFHCIAKSLAWLADPASHALCLTCEHELAGPMDVSAFVFTRAHGVGAGEAMTVMASPICPTCGQLDAAVLKDRVMATLREGMFPDMRELRPEHMPTTPGRA